MRELISLNYLILCLSWMRCCASISFTNQNYDGIQVGVPFTLTWEDADGAVELGLLFRMNSSSPQNITIIASGITDSQFAWAPPDWTSGAFAQKIEAQDENKNLALTGNFTIAEASDRVTSNQQVQTTVSTSLSSSLTAETQASSSNSTLPKENTIPQNGLSSAAKARIGFGICIVVVLVIIGVALIFFEHGKRVAAKAEQRQQPKSPMERAEHGCMGLELVETRLGQKEVEKEVGEEEPATPLLYKKPKLAVELDGVVMENVRKTNNLEVKDERPRKILSVRSIYELG